MAIHRVGRSRLGVANRSRLGVLTAGGEVKNLIIVIGDYDVGYQYYGSPPTPPGYVEEAFAFDLNDLRESTGEHGRWHIEEFSLGLIDAPGTGVDTFVQFREEGEDMTPFDPYPLVKATSVPYSDSDIDDYKSAIKNIVGGKRRFLDIYVWDYSHEITPPLTEIEQYLEDEYTYQSLTVEDKGGHNRWVHVVRSYF